MNWKDKFRFKDGEREIWPTHSLEPLAKVMKWGFFGKERDENKEVLL